MQRLSGYDAIGAKTSENLKSVNGVWRARALRQKQHDDSPNYRPQSRSIQWILLIFMRAARFGTDVELIEKKED